MSSESKQVPVDVDVAAPKLAKAIFPTVTDTTVSLGGRKAWVRATKSGTSRCHAKSEHINLILTLEPVGHTMKTVELLGA
jgi:hypothetical protein